MHTQCIYFQPRPSRSRILEENPSAAIIHKFGPENRPGVIMCHKFTLIGGVASFFNVTENVGVI